MAYVDGQVVGVRDRTTSAKATEGESRIKVLQELQTVFIQPKLSLITAPPFPMFTKKTNHRQTSSVRHSRFKVVHNKRNSILDTDIPQDESIIPPSTKILRLRCRTGGLKRVCTYSSEYALTFAFLQFAVPKLFNLARFIYLLSCASRLIV